MKVVKIFIRSRFCYFVVCEVVDFVWIDVVIVWIDKIIVLIDEIGFIFFCELEENCKFFYKFLNVV